MWSKLWRRSRSSTRIGIYIGNDVLAVATAMSGQPVSVQALPRQGALDAQLAALSGGHWRGAVCQIVLGAGLYDLITIDRPPLADDELTLALPWHIKELTRRPASRLVTDFFTLASQAAGQDKLSVVCSDTDTLAPLVVAVTATGAELVGISIEELAIARQQPDPVPVLGLTLVRGNELMLTIAKGGDLYLVRRLRGYQGLADVTLDQLDEALLEGLAVELQRSMDYFESQLRQSPVTRVQLALPVEEPALLAELMARHLAVPVRLWPLDELADAVQLQRHPVPMLMAEGALPLLATSQEVA